MYEHSYEYDLELEEWDNYSDFDIDEYFGVDYSELDDLDNKC